MNVGLLLVYSFGLPNVKQTKLGEHSGTFVAKNLNIGVGGDQNLAKRTVNIGFTFNM